MWASLTCAPVRLETDEAPRYLYIIEDITARRQIEEQLRISEARHRLIADNAIDVIATLDLAGAHLQVSPSVEKLRGFTPEEPSGSARKRSSQPALGGTIRPASTGCGPTSEAGRPIQNFRGELEQRCKDGSTVWTDVSASPLLSPDAASSRSSACPATSASANATRAGCRTPTPPPRPPTPPRASSWPT